MDTVCIIGAGPAGLAAGAALKARGIPFRILDAGRGPGGIWDIERADSPMYRSAHFISSRTLSALPGFPMPEGYPDYPSHELILEYVRDYARHHGLEEHATFGVRVTGARPVGETAPGVGDAAAGAGPARGPGWEVTTVPAEADADPAAGDDEATERFAALVVATGVSWHPNVPSVPGSFDGEIRHSTTYRSADELRGRRVLVVGAGNSGVDIACDAARAADRAFLSVRRGYRFIPKYVFGKPADVFAHAGPPLPAWLERRLFGFLIDRVLVGDLTRYGLPAPDHPALASHPIMNSQVLHHLGHGELEARPDVERLDGREVVFVDGSREEVDLVILATGYRRAFPFLELPVDPVEPEELLLMLLHRRLGTLFLMGVFETDGAAYPLFGEQAGLVARAVETVAAGGEAAERLARLRATGRPDLTGGRSYVDSPRHRWYVTDRAYRKAAEKVRGAMGW